MRRVQLVSLPTCTFPQSNRPHRLLIIQSTKTAPGTFGTLIIVLPSDHTGGTIKLTHNQKEKVAQLQNHLVSTLRILHSRYAGRIQTYKSTPLISCRYADVIYKVGNRPFVIYCASG